MFTCPLREASEDKVALHEISFKLLEEIVNFFYTTELKVCFIVYLAKFVRVFTSLSTFRHVFLIFQVTDDNIYELMSVADILQLSSVRKACASYLMSSLNPSNCLSVLTAASFHCGYNDLINDAVRFARKNLAHVAKGDEFLAAPADVLLKVFQGQVLNIPDEGFLLKVLNSDLFETQYSKSCSDF